MELVPIALFEGLRRLLPAVGIVFGTLFMPPPGAAQSVTELAREFPRTDFSKTEISFGEIVFDGARRDSIPPIHKPVFEPAGEVEDIGNLEPVISV